MPDLLRNLLDTFHRLDGRSVLDILLIAGAIYWLLLWLRGTSAMSLLRGVAIVAAVGAALGGLFNLTVVNWLLRNSLTALLVAIPIIFQPEIRRALERVGRTGMHGWRGRTTAVGATRIIAAAAQELAAIGHGALIVLEAETGLEDYVATGVRVDATLSVPLLLSIFYVNSAMHDGAVIIRDGRIAAASCTLPLGEHLGEGHLGTRHRAGIGISERTDALAVIVSEETGEISLASNGRLLRSLDADRLATLLDGFGESQVREIGPVPFPLEPVSPHDDVTGDAAAVSL